jgi:predicted RNase H-like nuclease (RuvC/YqgF family)
MIANFVAGFLGMSLLYVGVLSVVGHAFAWYQIHLLGSLTERLEKFDAENKRLEDSVNNFKEQNAKLKKVGDRLAEENEQFEAELTQMHSTLAGLETVQKTLETYAAENQSDLGEVIQSLNDTLAEQKQCVQKQSELLDQTKEATRSQEKILLMQLQSQCQFLDQSMGMTEQEYGMFLSMIPAKFKKTPAGMAFERVDRDGDGIVNVEEFHLLVDELVRSVALE